MLVGFRHGLWRSRMADGADHLADPDHLALREPAVELLEHRLCGLARLLGPAQGDHIAVDHGLDAEPVFEHCEVGVIVSEEIAHEPDVVEEHHQGFFPAIGRRGACALIRRGLAPTRQWRSPSAGLAGHTAA